MERAFNQFGFVAVALFLLRFDNELDFILDVFATLLHFFELPDPLSLLLPIVYNKKREQLDVEVAFLLDLGHFEF